MSTFGELKLRSTSPPPIDQEEGVTNGVTNDDQTNGFSTIDLNGTQSTSGPTGANTTDLSYTSFEKETAAGNSFSNPTPIHHQSIRGSPTSSSSPIAHNGTMSTSVSSSSSASMSVSSPSSIMSTAGEVSSKIASKTATTLENIRTWGKSAYKCTKQIVSEKLGKSARTVDLDIENSVEQLKEIRRKYENILTLANSMTAHFRDVVHSQQLLGENFSELAQKSAELMDEFTLNCETQRQLVKHGEILLDGLNHFTSSLRTLCHKTIEDTLVTVRHFEAARLEYDAYRSELEELKSAPTNEPTRLQQLRTLEVETNQFREKYEKLKTDVGIKMKFLDENRVKVMRKQLILFQNAIYVYFSGNSQALESIMRQFKTVIANGQLLDRNPDNRPTAGLQSFLEKN